MTDPLDATRRYKEITAWIGDAIGRMREQDRERTSQLGSRLDDVQETTNEALARAQQTRDLVADRWEAAVGELYHERWMRLTPMPRPDEGVPPNGLEFYEAQVERTYQDLVDAIRRRTIIQRRR
jgi:hypothetical protein